jgi:tripartite-type tricarboxylate transporter receptor subunit TctC
MKRATFVSVVFVALAFTGFAAAQSYPDHPVRIIVPYAPGGSLDTVARLVGKKLTDALGQQIVIDNRGGGGGNIGVEAAVRSAPDGYTLLMGANGPISINPSLYHNLPFDPIKDLAPISTVVTTSLMLVVNPRIPVDSVGDLIALAKAKPGTINFGSAGSGSTSHLSAELFKEMAGIDIVHIPYRGAGPAIRDVISGETQMMITAVVTTLPHVKSGKLKALAVTGPKRLPIAPQVPTIGEWLPGYEVVSWYGLFAPAKTPPAVIDRLHDALVEILAAPDLRQHFVALGLDASTDTPRQFAHLIVAEKSKWAKIIQKTGTHPD